MSKCAFCNKEIKEDESVAVSFGNEQSHFCPIYCWTKQNRKNLTMVTNFCKKMLVKKPEKKRTNK